MTKEQIDILREKILKDRDIYYADMIEKIKACKLIESGGVDKLIDYINNINPTEYFETTFLRDCIYDDIVDRKKVHDRKYWNLASDLGVNKYISVLNDVNALSCYEPSETVHFDGDIIITDPCYIIRAPHNGTTPITDDDWHACSYGYDMEVLGIKNYITRDTIYGDWSCTTYNSDTKESIGSFCADAGLVSVLALDEVLKYNPYFNYHEEKNWTTTLIENFKGDVYIDVVYLGDDINNFDYLDLEVRVVGKGVNKITGEPINFITTQTGL